MFFIRASYSPRPFHVSMYHMKSHTKKLLIPATVAQKFDLECVQQPVWDTLQSRPKRRLRNRFCRINGVHRL